MKKIIIWSVIIIAVIFGAYKYFAGNKPAATFVSESVIRGDLIQTVSATGEYISNQQIEVAFKSSGRIEKMIVNVGDNVVKGQKLVIIEKGVLWERLYQAEADIKFQKKTLSDMVDKKRTTTLDQRDAQRAVVQKMESAKNEVLVQIGETTMTSPMDGMVIQKMANQGEMAIANSSILTIADPNDLIIESNIPEADIVKVSVGQRANITFDALTDRDIFRARVVEIDPASTVIQDVVFYRVKLKVENADERLRIGMSCNDDIVTAEHSNVLMIPERAVKTEGEKQFVDVLKEDGITTEKRYIRTGLSGDNGVIEVKDGLKEGEKVVTFTKTS